MSRERDARRAITVRDSAGAAWRVYEDECHPTDPPREDGKLIAVTPNEERLALPPLDQWDSSKIYDGVIR